MRRALSPKTRSRGRSRSEEARGGPLHHARSATAAADRPDHLVTSPGLAAELGRRGEGERSGAPRRRRNHSRLKSAASTSRVGSARTAAAIFALAAAAPALVRANPSVAPTSAPASPVTPALLQAAEAVDVCAGDPGTPGGDCARDVAGALGGFYDNKQVSQAERGVLDCAPLWAAKDTGELDITLNGARYLAHQDYAAEVNVTLDDGSVSTGQYWSGTLQENGGSEPGGSVYVVWDAACSSSDLFSFNAYVPDQGARRSRSLSTLRDLWSEEQGDCTDPLCAWLVDVLYDALVQHDLPNTIPPVTTPTVTPTTEDDDFDTLEKLVAGDQTALAAFEAAGGTWDRDTGVVTFPSSRAFDDASRLKVLYVYSTQASALFPGANGPVTHTRVLAGSGQQVLHNSGIPMTIVPSVMTMPPAFQEPAESDVGDILDMFNKQADAPPTGVAVAVDPSFKAVLDERDGTNSDLVQFILVTGGTGISNLLRAGDDPADAYPINNFAYLSDHPFTVISTDVIATLTRLDSIHEIGHNMGAQHYDETGPLAYKATAADEAAGTDWDEARGLPTEFIEAQAWKMCGPTDAESYRTVMAYRLTCFPLNDPLPVFSTPTPDAGFVAPGIVGDDTHDNAAVLMTTRLATTNNRKGV
ncbi:hypothetical protein JKP88DRAFT_272201 [Tribonema minus]|uniref:Uncharacterized protein n=1 Tax=Tribonema minus TaxID=303371 RepID=A0A835ZFR9_9STRA|nr:hypothetical protein JKP88DRAFT_272201 [Tribonema minus]